MANLKFAITLAVMTEKKKKKKRIRKRKRRRRRRRRLIWQYALSVIKELIHNIFLVLFASPS
jgi:cell division septal protein FtsQ